MKILYTFFCGLLCLHLFSQQKIQLSVVAPGAHYDTASLYSYYPASRGNPALSVGKIENGMVSLSIDQSIPKGIYSIYASEGGNMNNSPWFDVYLDPVAEQTMIISWDIASGKPDFRNSEENTRYTVYRNTYFRIQNDMQQLDNFRRSFSRSSTGLNHALEESGKLLRRSMDSLLTANDKKEKPLWQKYFAVMHHYAEDPVDLTTFWDDFPIEDGVFHSPAIQAAQYRYHALLRETYKDQAAIDSIAITTLYSKFSRSAAGFSYVRDWLHAWFDNNATQKQYLLGVRLLSQAAGASAEEKEIYSRKWKEMSSLQPGKPFPLSSFKKEADRVFDDQDRLKLVFFSADCHFCVEELARLNANNSGRKENIVAVNVNKEEKTENRHFTSGYPNIRFIYPDNPGGVKEKLAFRGTPSEYSLIKQNGQWIISEMR
jgi:hypothetical protein